MKWPSFEKSKKIENNNQNNKITKKKFLNNGLVLGDLPDKP
jgi:hypothetical protein